MADLIFVRPTEEWVQTAAISASSSQAGYAATNVATDDPSESWRADSTGTTTLTVTLSDPLEVGLIALINTNADQGKVITIGGGITGSPTLTAARYLSGSAKDLVRVVSPAQTLSVVTFTFPATNTNKWAVGRVVIGKMRTLAGNFLDGFKPEPMRLQYSDENDFGHDIRYDLGVERWTLSGEVILTPANQVALDDWWSSTRGGFYPTTVVPDSSQYPPFFVRMQKSLPRQHTRKALKTGLTFVELSKGLEVIS